MKTLHVTPCFYPATYWGGPVFSTKAICDGISALPEFELKVLTTNSAGPHLWQRTKGQHLPYPVKYTMRMAGHAFAPGMVARLPMAVAWADVVHLTGTYNAATLPTMLCARLLGKPLVWSPRGALQATLEWGGAPHLRFKHLFHRLAATAMPRRAVVHATAAAEALAATRFFPSLETQTIPNAVALPARAPHIPSKRGLRLMYLGRLHPKKGLPRLLQAMRELPDDVTLDIYGDGPADHVNELQQTAVALRQTVRFHGEVGGADKSEAFARADLFVLPSSSENFGIVVAEALAHGVPVITTNATPWHDLEKHQCGTVIAVENGDLAAAIKETAQRDLRAMGGRGRAWVGRDFGPEQMVDSFAALYRDLASRQSAWVPA